MHPISCKHVYSPSINGLVRLRNVRIAGSETTATTLTVVLYYLCCNSAVLLKVRKEISENFSSYEEISAASAARLRYLHAVCLEALRIFPPLPLGLPRVVPKGGAIVDGNFVPGGVSRRPWIGLDRNFCLLDTNT